MPPIKVSNTYDNMKLRTHRKSSKVRITEQQEEEERCGQGRPGRLMPTYEPMTKEEGGDCHLWSATTKATEQWSAELRYSMVLHVIGTMVLLILHVLGTAWYFWYWYSYGTRYYMVLQVQERGSYFIRGSASRGGR